MSEGRKSYSESLEEVKKDVLEMASLTEKGICSSVEALENYDEELVQHIYNVEDESNKLNLEVEKECMRLVALQQPVAKDLRFIATMMKISDNFERICDLAEKIGKIAQKKGKKDPLKPLVDTNRMIDIICEMLEIVKEAIEQEDTSDLRGLSDLDDKVDDLFSQIYNELIVFMVKDPKDVDEATDLVFVARYLERSADLVAKIASRLVYMVEGERVQIK
ncbi:phosphate transport system regulatory protein PhoU [archaeon SCG-AAA382B04]|nr:phosphate transport system regulatory protein PhoU [archaeon SCG-AAA382B04]